MWSRCVNNNYSVHVQIINTLKLDLMITVSKYYIKILLYTLSRLLGLSIHGIRFSVIAWISYLFVFIITFHLKLLLNMQLE